MFQEFGLMLSHVPLHQSNLLRLLDKSGVYPDDCETLLNLHGHIHQNPSPEGPYKNMSVEAIDYTPVNIEELRVK
jgi:calcineurin-like phosphoesterase family protein